MFRIAILLAPLLSYALAVNGGIAASVSSVGVNYVVSQVIPLVEAELEKTTIPGISGTTDGFDYDLSDLNCPVFQIPSFTVEFGAPSDVAIALANLNIQCSSNYWFAPHDLHFLKQSGNVKVSVSSTSASVGVAITAANLEAQLQYQSSSISIGSIDITFGGSWLDWLINLFKPFIEGAVKKEFSSQFPSIIQSVIGDANSGLAKLQTSVPIKAPAPFDISEVRYGLAANPDASQGFIGVSLQGDIVPTSFPSTQEPPIPPPTIPPFNASSSAYYIEAQLSSYMLVSAVWTFWQAGLLVFEIPSDRIPGGLNSTSAYGLIVPGLAEKYPGGDVGLSLSLTGLPVIELLSSGGTTMWPFLFTFEVTPAGSSTPTFAFDFVADSNMTLTLALGASGDLVITGDLEFLYADLYPGNTTVGPISGLPLLNALVNFVLTDVVLPEINKFLVVGIPLPAITGVDFTKADLAFGNGYALLGVDFTFNPTFGAKVASSVSDK